MQWYICCCYCYLLRCYVRERRERDGALSLCGLPRRCVESQADYLVVALRLCECVCVRL